MCRVHLIRSSTRQVAFKEMKEVAADLKPVYTTPTAEAAQTALDEFDGKWGQKYPKVARRGHDCQILEKRVGQRRAVLQVPARDSAGDLHHQCQSDPKRPSSR